MASNESNSDEAAARRLRELFKGRFDQGTALCLLKEFGGELQAVDFVLNENENVVLQYLKTTPSYLKSLTADSKRIDEILEHGLEFSVRQFACEPCSRSWWKKVPSRKEVSKCNRCKIKYKPVPRENEWGWAKFHCVCDNEFHGWGEMNVTTSVCYDCSQPVPVETVLPPRRRIGQRKTRTPHSCDAENCYNRHCSSANQTIHMGPVASTIYGGGGTLVQNVYATGPSVADTKASSDPVNKMVGSNPATGTGGNKKKPGKKSNGNIPGAYPKQGAKSKCVHPKSRRPGDKHIRTASERHYSSGSTVTTFLSQGSLDTRSEAVVRIPETIHEN